MSYDSNHGRQTTCLIIIYKNSAFTASPVREEGGGRRRRKGWPSLCLSPPSLPSLCFLFLSALAHFAHTFLPPPPFSLLSAFSISLDERWDMALWEDDDLETWPPKGRLDHLPEAWSVISCSVLVIQEQVCVPVTIYRGGRRISPPSAFPPPPWHFTFTFTFHICIWHFHMPCTGLLAWPPSCITCTTCMPVVCDSGQTACVARLGPVPDLSQTGRLDMVALGRHCVPVLFADLAWPSPAVVPRHLT